MNTNISHGLKNAPTHHAGISEGKFGHLCHWVATHNYIAPQSMSSADIQTYLKTDYPRKRKARLNQKNLIGFQDRRYGNYYHKGPGLFRRDLIYQTLAS